MMSFTEAVRSGFRRWSDVSGRSSRSEYWWWALFYFLVVMGITIITILVVGANRGAGAIAAVFILVGVLVLVVPTLTVAIRRLHDTDRSGWWLLIGFVPYIGGLVLLVFYVLDGSPGPNRFGPRPGGNLSTWAPPTPFAPTNRVPPEGMASWPTADPSGPVTQLAGGLHLAVIHRVDDWAQVRASNGWVGWVDARRLVSFAPPPPPPPADIPA